MSFRDTVAGARRKCGADRAGWGDTGALGAGGLPDGPYVPQRKTIVEMNNKTGEVWLKNPEADANEQVCGVRAPLASCIPRAGGSFCAGAGRRGRDLVFTET